MKKLIAQGVAIFVTAFVGSATVNPPPCLSAECVPSSVLRPPTPGTVMASLGATDGGQR